MAKNLFLQSPDAGDIQDVFAQGAQALQAAPVYAQGIGQREVVQQPAQAAPVSAPASTPRRPAPTAEDITRRAVELGIDPALPLAIWGVESGSNFNSRDSYKGAAGGMQVMPDTYKMMMGSYSGQRDPWNNMEAGLRYIAHGQKALGTTDPALLAAGYHAGYGRKDLKAGQIPQNIGDGLMKTKDYAAKVASKVGLGGATKAAPNLQQQLDQEEQGRYQVLTEQEAQALQRKQLQSTLDTEEAGRFQVLTDDELTKLPASASMPEGIAPKQEGSFLGDIGRMALGGINKGVGQAVGGVGEAARIVGEYTTTPLINAVFGTQLRTGNALKPIADFYKQAGEGAQAGVSQESAQAIKDSTPDGDLFKPSTWSFGANPTARGVLMLTTDVLGSMAPVIAASIASGGSAAVGAAVGAAQSGGAAADQARQTIQEMAKAGTLGTESAYYRELIAQGKSPAEAVAITADAAANLATPMAAIVGGLGGAATAKIINPATNIVGGAPLAGRIAGRAGVGAVEEGAQEVAEGVAGRAGTNLGAGTNVDLTEGSFGDAVLGAMGGGTTGAGAGALSSRTAPQEQPKPVARQEPVIDVTYQDEQGNTVTEVVPAEKPSGPITRAVEKLTPKQTIITDDEGKRHILDTGTGEMTLVPEDVPAAPIEQAVEQAVAPEGNAPSMDEFDAQFADQPAIENEADSAQQEPIAAAKQPETQSEQAQAAPKEEANTGDENDQNAPQVVENKEIDTGPDKPLTEWTEPELRTRLKYVTQQAKAGGWDGRLVKERGRVSKEINRRNSEARNDQNTTTASLRTTDVAPASDQTSAPMPIDQQARSATAEVTDVRADAGQAGARATELPVRATGAGADAAAQPDAALKDPYAGRWFGSEEKANSYMAKQNAADTHEVVKTGKVRFEVKPKRTEAEINELIEREADSLAVAEIAYGQQNAERSLAEFAEANRLNGEQSARLREAAKKVVADRNARVSGEAAPKAAPKFNREQTETEITRQLNTQWSAQTGDGFAVGKHYPATISVNGKERKLGMFKKKGSGTLYAEALDQTIYGPVFTQYKVNPSGKLEEVGARNLFGRDNAVAEQAVAEFNALFEAKPEVAPASEQAPSTDADLDTMFDDAVAAKKQGDAKPEAAPAPKAKKVAQQDGSQVERAKAAGIKGLRAGTREDVLAQRVKSHLAGERAAKHIEAGQKTDMPQYKGIKEADARTFGALIVENQYSVDTSDASWVFDARGVQGVDRLVAGGLLEEGDAKYKHVLTPVGKELARNLLAKPIGDQSVDAMLAEIEQRKPAAKKAAPAKTEAAKAAESLTSAAKNTAAGLTSAIDGLGELFGGAGKVNSGLSFDEDTYAKAKPLFQQAIAQLGDAGRDLKAAMQAIVNMVMDKFGEEATQRMKPYVVRFVKDVRDGATENKATYAEQASDSTEKRAPTKQRIAALKKQFAKAKEGQMALSVEASTVADGSEGVRYFAVDGAGNKVGLTQITRASLSDEALQGMMERFAQDVAVANKRMNKPQTPEDEIARAPKGMRFSVAPDQTETAAFKRWFGDSKVVDADGKPLVVYHGTTHTEITEFLPAGARDGEWQQALERFKAAQKNNAQFGYLGFRSGTYFSPKPEVANGYTRENTGVVYPVYIKAENPVYVDKKNGTVRGIDPNKTIDALILHDNGDINEIAVIDPTQIKSATGNNGNFDATNPDIRYSFAGESAVGANIEALKEAQAMDARGANANAILRDTGWHKGVDGKWRFEIDDSQATFKTHKHDSDAEAGIAARLERDAEFSEARESLITASINYDGRPYAAYGLNKDKALANLRKRVLNGELGVEFDIENARNNSYALNDVLDHEQLLSAYPFLRSLDVEFNGFMEKGERGSYNERQGRVTINADLSAEQKLSTLLHELQHAIQNREGFAQGGNSDSSFVQSIKQTLANMRDGEFLAVQEWKVKNKKLIDDAEVAGEVARNALKYDSAQRLMSYANRESPSGVMRLIRNEMQWLYSEDMRNRPDSVQLQRDFYDIPKPSNLKKRNQFLRDFAERGANMLRDSIPAEQLALFRSDERTTKGMIEAMRRQARKARDKLKPLNDLESSARRAEQLANSARWKSPYEIYRSLAGEIEARVTQARQGLTAAERRSRHPSMDADVSMAEAVVIVGGMEMQVPIAMSQGAPEADFGPVSTDYRADPKGAIEWLKKQEDGEAIIDHPTLGEVSLVWGDGSMGLSHIARRHGEKMLDRIPALLKEQDTYTKANQNARVFLGNETDEAAIRLDWNGKDKVWLVSAYEKHGDAPKASTQAAPQRAGKLDAPALRKEITSGALGKVVDQLIESGEVVVHQSDKTLPKEARGVRGVQAVTMPDNKIHMVAGNIARGNAQAVLLHEMFHRGGESVLGQKEWGNTQGRLGSLYRQAQSGEGKMNAFYKKAADRVRQGRANGAISTAMTVEEFGAYAIEEYSKDRDSLPTVIRKWVEDVIGFAKAYMLSRYGKQMGELTPAQLAGIAKLAVLNKAVTAAKEGRFSADGDQTNTEAFRKWFGDSKVVDADGKPLVVYHGTKRQITQFDGNKKTEKDSGWYGRGIYMTADPNTASAYSRYDDFTKKSDSDGSHVMPLYVSIQNPYIWPANRKVATTPEEAAAIREEVVANGHDGIFVPNDYAEDAYAKHYEVIAFRPEQIKSATGNNGQFDTANPDIRYSVADEETDIQTGATGNEPPEGVQDTFKPADPSRFENFQAKFQNNMNRVRKVQERIKELTGVSNLGRADYYGAETNRPGRVAARLEDAKELMFKPMLKKLAKTEYKPEDLESLLHAQHAHERNAAIARINPDMADGGSGMTNAEADAILAKYKDAKELHALADDARAMARETLDLKRAYGLVTAEDYDALQDAYESYVPLKGDGEYGPKVKRAMGHDAREEYILENIARDYEQAVMVGEKNLARQSLLALVAENPDENLWTLGMPPRGRYIAGQVYTIKDSALSAKNGGDVVAQFTSQSQVNAFLEAKGSKAGQFVVEDSNGDRVTTFIKPLQDNEVMVYVDGRPVRIQVFDEHLAQQLRPLDQAQMGVLLEGARKVNRYLSSIYTGYNPYFILKNAVRDMITGTINMTGNQGAKVATKAWTKYGPANKAIAKWAATGKYPEGKYGAALREYRDQGGKTGASYMSDLEAHTRNLDRMYEDAYGVKNLAKDGRPVRAAWVAGRKAVMGLAHTIEIANQATENALRLSLYMTLREQGESAGKAAQAAKTVTVDFDRKGAMTGSMGAMYIFFNPAVQGTANAFNTLARGKHKKQAWAALGALATLGLFAATQGMDDDEDRWQGLGWDKRTKNFIITAGDHTLTIPLSQEFAPAYALGAAIGEAMRGESAMKSTMRLLSSFIDAYVPFNGIYSPDSKEPLADVSMAMTPTALRPLLEVAFNRNVFGSQIVPESQFNESAPDNTKMNRTTKGTPFDSTAQMIADLGVAAGANRYEDSITKISPETLKYLWSTYTGGLGRFVTDTVGITRLTATAPDTVSSSEVPFLKDFWQEHDVKPLRSRFYDLAGESKAASSQKKLAEKAGDDEALAKLENDPEAAHMLSMSKVFTGSARQVRAIREEQLEVSLDEKMSVADKRRKLKELEAQEEVVYREAFEQYKDKR